MRGALLPCMQMVVAMGGVAMHADARRCDRVQGSGFRV
jgi:hypothetical protein